MPAEPKFKTYKHHAENRRFSFFFIVDLLFRDGLNSGL